MEHIHNIEEPIIPETIKEAAESLDIKITAEEIAILGAIPLVDIIYHTSLRDPEAVNAITMSGEDNPRGFLEIRSYLEESVKDNPGGEWSGWITRLKGYTGEQEVATVLREKGSRVIFADTPNNEGWDLEVDGEKVDVKITADPGYIQDHLEKYPDIDIYTNAEMSEYFQDNPQVHVLPEIHNEEILKVTEDTVDGFINMGGMLNWVPWTTVAISGLRNMTLFFQGKTNGKTVLKNMGLDAAGMGGGCWVGGTLALAWLGPPGMIIGAIAGGIGGKMLTEKIKFETSDIKKYQKTFFSQLKEFCNAFYDHCTDKVQELQKKRKTVGAKSKLLGKFYGSASAEKLIKKYDDNIATYEGAKKTALCSDKDDNKSIIEKSSKVWTILLEQKIYFAGMNNIVEKIKCSSEDLTKEMDKYSRNTWIDKSLNTVTKLAWTGVKETAKTGGKMALEMAKEASENTVKHRVLGDIIDGVAEWGAKEYNVDHDAARKEVESIIREGKPLSGDSLFRGIGKIEFSIEKADSDMFLIDIYLIVLKDGRPFKVTLKSTKSIERAYLPKEVRENFVRMGEALQIYRVYPEELGS